MICTKPTLLDHSGQTVRCGQCYGCRLKKRRDWAIRIMDETRYYDDNSFVTLTYDDVCIPENNTLVKEHLQKFFKRLRKRLKTPIRYFACGEYGDENNKNSKRKGKNPHYHIIIFGKDFRDKDRKIKQGLYKSSKEINDSWLYGNTTTGPVTIDSAKYVAGYVQKKITGDKAFIYEEEKRIPEFALMSRGGRGKDGENLKGIGSRHYDRHMSPRICGKDGLQFIEQTEYKGKLVEIPKYYKDKNRKYKVLLDNIKVKEREERINKKNEKMEELRKKLSKRKDNLDIYDLILEKNGQIDRNLRAKERIKGGVNSLCLQG